MTRLQLFGILKKKKSYSHQNDRNKLLSDKDFKNNCYKNAQKSDCAPFKNRKIKRAGKEIED